MSASKIKIKEVDPKNSDSIDSITSSADTLISILSILSANLRKKVSLLIHFNCLKDLIQSPRFIISSTFPFSMN